MTFGAAVLLTVALRAGPVTAASPVRPVPIPACTRYRVLAEKNDLAPEKDVAGWATAALERAALFDKNSPCYVHVRITAGPIRSGGRQDGWVAHVAVSTRRYLRGGKLVSNEKGMLLVEAEKDALVARARSLVEEYAARLKIGGTAPEADTPDHRADSEG